jgi:hypothetical protein
MVQLKEVELDALVLKDVVDVAAEAAEAAAEAFLVVDKKEGDFEKDDVERVVGSVVGVEDLVGLVTTGLTDSVVSSVETALNSVVNVNVGGGVGGDDVVDVALVKVEGALEEVKGLECLESLEEVQKEAEGLVVDLVQEQQLSQGQQVALEKVLEGDLDVDVNHLVRLNPEKEQKVLTAANATTFADMTSFDSVKKNVGKVVEQVGAYLPAPSAISNFATEFFQFKHSSAGLETSRTVPTDTSNPPPPSQPPASNTSSSSSSNTKHPNASLNTTINEIGNVMHTSLDPGSDPEDDKVEPETTENLDDTDKSYQSYIRALRIPVTSWVVGYSTLAMLPKVCVCAHLFRLSTSSW